MRHRAAVEHLRALQQEYFSLLTTGLEIADRGIASPRRLNQLKAQMPLLRRHYHWTHTSVVTALYALLCCLSSTLVMTCRTLIGWNSLISAALLLFVAGLTILFFSLGLMLLDVCMGQRSLWQELLGRSPAACADSPKLGGRTQSSQKILQISHQGRRRGLLGHKST
ncbi:MAG: DUF2721 domain-containing protein [Leptolyngbyaceae cyanobacterium CRU_2_3]|nr:DUF2721 domain-containing protein [Leptolyngbyaceae cyanobacterium CRU_2_3]